MDRTSQLRGEAGGSRDSTLDTSSPPSQAFITANESSSKFYSLSEVDSTFDISPIKDVSLASTAADSEGTITNTSQLISNLSPIGNKSDILDGYKIGKHIEAANILSGGVAIFDDNEENSYDGDELVIDDNPDDEKGSEKHGEGLLESTLIHEEADIGSKDSEVVLQIDGKNVDAIDIGNGLYLYRKEGQEELAAVQIIDDDQQQPSFKFLKVRENAEGNLEVYEEIEIEVPKEVPAKEGKTINKSTSSHVPIKDINKVISDAACNKVAERKLKVPVKETISTSSETEPETSKDVSPDSKSELNFNGKMMKFSEMRKSPVIGSFTPMTFHSTPNKEGKPLTKTMVDQQLHPNRHSDNVKKTIEVHTDVVKQKISDTPTKKDIEDKVEENTNVEKDTVTNESIETVSDNNTNPPQEKVTDVDEKDDISKTKITESKEIITLSAEKVTTSEEKVTVSVDKVASEQKANVSEEKETVSDSGEKIAASEEKVSVSEERVASSGDIVSVSEENVTKLEEKLNASTETVTLSEEKVPASEDKVSISEENVTKSEEKVNASKEKVTLVSEQKVTISDDKTKETVSEAKVTTQPKENAIVLEENLSIPDEKSILSKENSKEIVTVSPENVVVLENKNIIISDPKADESKSNYNNKTKNDKEVKNDVVKPKEVGDNRVNESVPIEQDNVIDSTREINNKEIKEIITIEESKDNIAKTDIPSDANTINKQEVSTCSKDEVLETEAKLAKNISAVQPVPSNDKQVNLNEDIIRLDSESEDEDKIYISEEIITEEPMEIDCEIKENKEVKTQNDNAAIEIVKTDMKQQSQQVESVEINLKDKDDKSKLEEGILIIDDDNTEGTVVTIDDIIDNTPNNYDKEPIIRLKSQNMNSEVVEICASKTMANKSIVTNIVAEKPKSIESVQADSTSTNIAADFYKAMKKDNNRPISVDNIGSSALKVQKEANTNKNISLVNQQKEIIKPIENKQIPRIDPTISLVKKSDKMKKPIENVPSLSLDKISKHPIQPATIIAATAKQVTFVPHKLPIQSLNEAVALTIQKNKGSTLLQQQAKGSEKSMKIIESHESITGKKLYNIMPAFSKVDTKMDKLQSHAKAPSNVLDRSKMVSQSKPYQMSAIKPAQPVKVPTQVSQKIENKQAQLPSKDGAQVKSVNEVSISKVPNIDPVKPNASVKQDTSKILTEVAKGSKIEAKEKRAETQEGIEPKPMNNNHAAVPFGQWTEANRQEFLNKFKSKVPVNAPNSSQLKNSNDLNRRDVLKKIDSQRQTSNALSKTQEASKNTMKKETAFATKTNITKEVVEDHSATKAEATEVKPKPVVKAAVTKNTKHDMAPKGASKQESANKPTSKQAAPKAHVKTAHATKSTCSSNKSEASQRTGLTVTEIIDKTVEGMLHKGPPPKSQDEIQSKSVKDTKKKAQTTKHPQVFESSEEASKLDDIEMKMNELHGIPFIERPPHELPQPQLTKPEPKTYSQTEKEKQTVSNKTTKIPNLLPHSNKNQQKPTKESGMDVESDDEIIEHEPITGDININKKNPAFIQSAKDKSVTDASTNKMAVDGSKKESIITEKDFDKFARRNSKTYEDCLTVNFDSKESHNVVQSAVPKTYSKHETARFESKTKPTYSKHRNVNPATRLDEPVTASHKNRFSTVNEDLSNRNQSKVQKAYQSVLSEKRQMANPITIIEDKPVKVVFMDNVDFVPGQLNVQGKELSPAKKPIPEPLQEFNTCDSLDSDTFDTDSKCQEVKTKTKHQRKQVLTPVEEPELELIEPKDIGLEASPKKKRKTEEDRNDKNLKYPVRKKFYQYAAAGEKGPNISEVSNNPLQSTVNRNDMIVTHKDPVSAIDSLVKAAELIETQTETLSISNVSNSTSTPSSQSGTPVKRGRGRPRKYPLPEGGAEKKPSPQKKPRLIDAKPPKRDTTTDEDDSDDEIIKENWTMGKINENIVCPICNKLFRTENVVFKHVKHCTGPSPSRSDSDKRSPVRMRRSQESESKSADSKSDFEDDLPLVRRETPKKRKSKDSTSKSDSKDEVIVIEDTPIKEKPQIKDERKNNESRKPNTKLPYKTNELVCEFCGKKFRQLSHLVYHSMQQHKKERMEKEMPNANKSVHSCEVCKKEFRKLHHLVQHRIIHNPTSAPVRTLRKSSSEQTSSAVEKEPTTSKQSEDPSAGFRCEPCDKSFRKLHHLVEHRETHDGINSKQKPAPTTQTNPDKSDKPVSIHQCDVCKKTFRKLHYLIEHKELHLETSSEKSDDKSVKSCLSTRDIIHECSLCYMVFPNEHSLNKHAVNCARKKRQSKQQKPANDADGTEETSEEAKVEEKMEDIEESPLVEDSQNKDKQDTQPEVAKQDITSEDIIEVAENKTEPIVDVDVPQKVETKPIETPNPTAKREFTKTEIVKETIPEVPEKVKKVDEEEVIVIQDTPKKKTPLKEKPTAVKRIKTPTAPNTSAVVKQEKPAESSDDDEVRYMLNPNYKNETEEKVFMKVRAKKRSSLQIERPNSKDLVKRRTSLQHPPKIPRLKSKTETNSAVVVKTVAKILKEEPMQSTDSDDSETTKYSFPTTVPEKPAKPAPDRTTKEIEKKTPKKTLADKRKTLGAIAKRKSVGKVVTARHKVSPVKQIKRRTLAAEHRCDCGQLFSSAALLSRHTTLAHTPPRVRRRRSPPPPPPAASQATKRTTISRRSTNDSATSKTTTKATRKSTVQGKDPKTPAEKVKQEKVEGTSTVTKPRRSGMHRGVPIPEKMKKLMQKSK